MRHAQRRELDLETRLYSGNLTTISTPFLALPAFGQLWSDPAIKALDKALGGKLRKLAREEGFTGKAGQTLSVAGGRVAAARVSIYGLGKAEKEPGAQVQAYACRAGRAARSKGLARFALVVPALAEAETDVVLRWLTEGAALGTYRFGRHKTGDRKPKREPSECRLVIPTFGREQVRPTPEMRESLRAGRETAAAINFARDLVNEPANVLTPTELAVRAEALAKELGITANVLGPKEIRRRGMRLLEAVNQGSKEPARFIHLVYEPKGGEKRATIALVGKGLTFDSGGLSLKPAKGQVDMKGDMAGAAAVLATIRAAATLALPAEIHGIIPSTENMPGGAAVRPGDVIESMNGKTVEVLNTDAEGRLILADALAYAVELKPDVIIDLATLTGACMVALGPHRAGLWSTSDTWGDKYVAAAARAGEAVWRMPLAEELREGLKSEVADLRNVGDSWGGAITAALFLEEFVGKTPWLHVDIAGPSFLEKPHGVHPKGGTGYGVLTLLELMRA